MLAHLMSMTQHPRERLDLLGLHIECILEHRVLDRLGGALEC